MYTDQIEFVLENSIDPAKCQALGAYPRNLIPTPAHARLPTCFVANTEKDTEPGEHWVAFYFPAAAEDSNEFEFFDSYGQHPSTYNFPPLLPFQLSSFNRNIFQSIHSDSCGQFCLYYLHARSLGFNSDYISNSLSRSDLKWNDKFVKTFVLRFLRPKLYSKFATFNSLPESPYSQFSSLKTIHQIATSYSHFKNKFPL